MKKKGEGQKNNEMLKTYGGNFCEKNRYQEGVVRMKNPGLRHALSNKRGVCVGGSSKK